MAGDELLLFLFSRSRCVLIYNRQSGFPAPLLAMAGIAEASAIITVAQVGIGLSQTIIAFVSDVRDAPKTIVRIGNEIKTTSGRLKEIAGLIEENTTNRLLSDEGVGDVARCSYECDLILAQVGNLLIKGGWRKNETAFDKDDIDISLFSALKWPFLKSRLETPRAELQIIKADLNLLFTAAMARKYVISPLSKPSLMLVGHRIRC